MTPHLIRLYWLLAELFGDEATSGRIMVQAGIDRGRIHSETNAIARWYAIVSEAEKAGKVAALIDVALSEFPKHAELKMLRAELVTEGCAQ